MKKRMAAAGAMLLATGLVAQVASAKTLEDVLKEKGVITEADYKEITKAKPIDYKLGSGFTFTSPDTKFQLSIGSQMQIRYTMFDADRSASDQSKFELKRIKLNLNGYAFSKDLTYKVIINLTNGTNSAVGLLEESYLNYRLIDEAQFRFGQDKVQFARQWITPSSLDQFVDASPATTAFAPGYDTGLSVNGKIAGGLAYYSVGGYGGAGQNDFRAARDNAFAARVAVNPLGDMPYSEGDMDNSKKPLVSVGSSFYRNTLNNTATGAVTNETTNIGFAKTSTTPLLASGWYGIGRTGTTAAAAVVPAAKQIDGTVAEAVDFNTAEIDAAFKWRGFSAQGEYFWGQADGQKSNNKVVAQGYYVQAGYFIIPSTLEVAARYSYLDPNRDVANDHWVETTGAVSWYINKHNLKIQADCGSIHRQGNIASTGAGPTARPTDDLQARVQAQLLF